MDIDKIMTRLNPWIIRLLESRFHGLLSRGLMVLSIRGNRTGRCYKIPVGYQKYGDHIVALVSRSRRKNWWRNFRSENPVEVTVGGLVSSGLASLVDKESAEFKEMISATFKRMPGLSRQFGVKLSGSGGLSGYQWDVVKLEAEVVLIKL